MKSNLLTSLLLLLFLSLNAQDNINMTLLSNVQYGENSSDIWGFVDTNGIEYAIIGGASNTRIYSLEDPSARQKECSLPPPICVSLVERQSKLPLDLSGLWRQPMRSQEQDCRPRIQLQADNV